MIVLSESQEPVWFLVCRAAGYLDSIRRTWTPNGFHNGYRTVYDECLGNIVIAMRDYFANADANDL